MARSVFSAPADLAGVLTALRNLYARLTGLRAVRPLTGAGTDAQRIAALETKVNELLSRLAAVTKE